MKSACGSAVAAVMLAAVILARTILAGATDVAAMPAATTSAGLAGETVSSAYAQGTASIDAPTPAPTGRAERASSVTLHVVDTDPPAPARLAAGDSFYLRIGYDSAQPVRIRGRGVAGGQARELPRSNPSPAYPAGRGEALVWFASDQPLALDAVRVIAHDASWQPIAEISVPLRVEWSGERAAPRAPADWARTLSDAQQQAVVTAAREVPKSAWADALVVLAMWSVPLYLLLQALALWKLRGGWRTAAAVILVLMLPVFGHALYALATGSNIWPIGLIFICPIACFYLLGLLLVRWVRAPATG